MQEIKNIRNFVIIAHVDHGKSTLADRFLELTGTVEKRQLREQFLDQMELERERGITIKMQPVRMLWHPHRGITQNNTQKNAEIFRVVPRELPRNSAQVEQYVLNLIDTPGHVDFSYEVSRSLAAVEGAILLVDASQGIQAQTLANFHLAKREGLKILGAVTKIDIRPPNIEGNIENLARLIGVSTNEIYRVSGKTGEGVKELLRGVIAKIPPPGGEKEKPLRALIFDSFYDPYKGAIAYVRIVEGKIKRGEEIFLLAATERTIALEIGIFKPKLEPKEELIAGEIGYIATGIKEAGKVRVGDTITTADLRGRNAELRGKFLRKSAFSPRESAAVKPLPGYQEPQPMVFASFYPKNDTDFQSLKDALEKLKLNDASLNFVPTRQEMLGQGFRLGFLGTLHLEIVKERLVREYGLEPIITLPSVLFKVKTLDGADIPIHTPQELPPPNTIKEIEEPWVLAEILTPAEFLGQIILLIQNARGFTTSTETLGREILVKCEMPLTEIILDFYNTLKSVSRGYASLAYEVDDWRKGDLVKVDILVNYERVDSFSRIMPKSRTEEWGRATIERLKEILPREVFQVPIQAAIGSDVIARVTMPALKKDVTSHLYGGDRTRKMKLWKKQKAGKKKLAALGKVDIPATTFFEIFKQK